MLTLFLPIAEYENYNTNLYEFLSTIYSIFNAYCYKTEQYDNDFYDARRQYKIETKQHSLVWSNTIMNNRTWDRSFNENQIKYVTTYVLV